MVPVLGMENDGDAGHATPMAGSMEDADGKGRREYGGLWKPWGDVAEDLVKLRGVVSAARALMSQGMGSFWLYHQGCWDPK